MVRQSFDCIQMLENSILNYDMRTGFTGFPTKDVYLGDVRERERERGRSVDQGLTMVCESYQLIKKLLQSTE